MGVYDFLSQQTSNKDFLGGLFSGSYSISMGDNLSSFIGSGRQTHIVGDEIKYVFDWIRCLEQIPYLKSLMGVLPLNALLGEGGNMTWTFGRKTDLHYIGPAIAINRAGKKAATSKSNFYSADKTPEGLTAKKSEEWDAKEKVAKCSGILVGLLSAVMLGVNTGYEVYARVRYQSGYTKYKASASTSDKDAFDSMTRDCTLTLILTTRMMYAIKSLELCTAMAQTAITKFYTGEREAGASANAAICTSIQYAIAGDIVRRLLDAGASTKEFLKDMGKLILALAFIAYGILVGLAAAGVIS